jgi:hypothetical protein
MYQICLCLNGSWKYLALDEYLPCFPTTDATGGLVCSKSRHTSSIWLPLLEKGICKHYSTYNLHETPITREDILLMCTGAPLIKFGEENKIFRENSLYSTNSLQNKLWNQLVEHLEQHSLLICQTVPFLQIMDTSRQNPATTSRIITSENGLPFEKTSFTLLRLFETSTQEYIMQFRYPFHHPQHPDFEWLGDWSDQSMKWTSQIEFEIGLEVRQEIDTFWISFHDFLQYFTQVLVCCLRSEEINGQEWTEHRTRSWFQLKEHPPTLPLPTSSPSSVTPTRVAPSTACYPILSNMYILKVSNESTEVYFTLHQLLNRSYHQFDIALAILRVTPEYTFELVASTDLTVSQYISTSVRLSPDVYLLVPLTTGAHLLQYKSTHQFRSPDTSRPPIELFSHRNKRFTDEAEEAFSEIFDRLDNDMDDVSLPSLPSDTSPLPFLIRGSLL